MYWSRTGSPLELFAWLLLVVLWSFGGWLICTHLFRLKPRERLLAGAATGMLLFIVFSNVLARILPLPAAFWGGGLLVPALGILAAWRSHRRPWLQVKDWLAWPQILGFAVLLALFIAINRGLAIFDDYYNLPLVSMMAAGDVPPHFHLDVQNWLAYHYGLHLFAASLVRVAGFFPWSAFDLSKAITLALTPALAWLWFRRLTRNPWISLAGAALVLLGGGARWLLLLLSPEKLVGIGSGLHLLGSGAASGANLYAALSGPWRIEGAGPFPFPFAFANGIFPPLVLALASAGALPQVTLVLLLLLARRRWSPLSGIVYGLLLASLALTAEHIFVIFCLGLALAAAASGLRRRSLTDLLTWAWALLPAGLLALAGGGVITEMARSLLDAFRNVPASDSNDVSGFVFIWPPALLSSHLGPLSLVKRGQVLIGLAEVGPVLLLAPGVIRWSWRKASRGWWAASALGLGATLSFGLSLFAQYGMERDISRLTGTPLFIWLLLGFPLAWLAVQRNLFKRVQGPALQTLWAAAYGVTLLGGVVILAIQLIAISHPQLTYFIQESDAQFARLDWNRLAPGAQVLDHVPYRSVTIFGRGGGNAYLTTYEPRPAWEKLIRTADPHQAAEAGYGYIYMDRAWWSGLDPQLRDTLQVSCVKKMAEQKRDNGDFRWLLDIRACHP